MDIWQTHHATLLDDLSYGRVGHKSLRAIQTRCLKKEGNVVWIVGLAEDVLLGESVRLSDGKMGIIGSFPRFEVLDFGSN